MSEVQPIVTSKDAIRERFSVAANEWAATYAEPASRTLTVKNLLARQRFVLQLVTTELPPGAHILDIGCGPGEMAAKLMECGYDVWGIDIAEPMVRHAQERCGVDQFRVADMEHLPFPDASFDGIVCLGVIEYLEADRAALSEMRRVLKPAGVALIATPSAACPLYHIDRIALAAQPLYDFLKYRLRGRRAPDRPHQGYGRKYRRGPWLRSLRANGLEPNAWLCYGWGWHNTRLGALVDRLSRGVDAIGRTLARVLGRGLLDRAGGALARSRLVNWMAFEQLVRVRSVKYPP